MLEIKHLTKTYGNVNAVSDITFSAAQGEILGFLGPNGAGKTTTMRILAGIFPPTSGRAVVGNLDVTKNSLEVRQKIGYMPEQIPLYPELTVTEYLQFVVSIWSFEKKEKQKRIGQVLEECSLQDVKNRLIGHLSRGYRQRIGLAQALVHDPEVLILDEPTVGLDPRQIREIRKLIKSFQGKKTVILSTHILPEVSMTCEKVVIIHHGKVVAQGTVEELTRQFNAKTEIEITLESVPKEAIHTLLQIPGIETVEILSSSESRQTKLLIQTNRHEIRPQIARMIVEKNWKLYGMSLRSRTLEDIFVELVTQEEF